MEDSTKPKKITSYKKARRQFLYNLALYSLTSMITFSFFSYPFWFPAMEDYFISLMNDFWILFNAKFLFVMANIIVLFLVGESRTAGAPESSLASEVYDEYVTRSQRMDDIKSNNEIYLDANMEEGKLKRVEKKLKNKMRLSKSMVNLSERDEDVKNIEEKRVQRRSKNEMRTSKSMLNLSKIKEDDVVRKIKEKRVEKRLKNEMRTSKSMLNLSEIKEDEILPPIEEKMVEKELKNEVRMPKSMLNLSEIREDVAVQEIEKEKVEKILQMRTSKSLLNLSSIREDTVVQKIEVKGVDKKLNISNSMLNLSQKMKECKSTLMRKGMRTSKSAIWGENEIMKISSIHTDNQEDQLDLLPTEELNTRVEAFIARVNKKRLLEGELK